MIFIFVLALAAAVAAPFLAAPSGARYCDVLVDQQRVRHIKLADGFRETFVVEGENGVTNTVEIDGTRARVREAGCPDQVCVRTGWLTRAGQSAVCLPGRVIVRLTGAKPAGGVDAIVGGAP